MCNASLIFDIFRATISINFCVTQKSRGDDKLNSVFSISQAAAYAHMTTETLRHYDRIGLVKPSVKNELTKYRYYTAQDIVRLNTVHALQQMDLPLRDIKTVLEYEDLQRIIDFLEQAEKKADEKMADLQNSKHKIQLAKADYMKKLQTQQHIDQTFIRAYPQRMIMLSDTLQTASLENLWNYLSHFYSQIPASQRQFYTFEDLAGVYTSNGISRLFAVCARYPDTTRLMELPSGNYLCAGCSREKRQDVIKRLVHLAKKEYAVDPAFTVELVVVSGILHWNFQIELYLGKEL